MVYIQVGYHADTEAAKAASEKDEALKQKALAKVAEVKSEWPAGDAPRRRQSVMLGKGTPLLTGAGAGGSPAHSSTGTSGVHSPPLPSAKPKRRGSSVMDEVIQQAFSEKFGHDSAPGSPSLSHPNRTRGGSYVPFNGSGGVSSLIAGEDDISQLQLQMPDPDDVSHFYTDDQGYYHQRERAPLTATAIAENIDFLPPGMAMCNAKFKAKPGHELRPNQIIDSSKVNRACVYSCMRVFVFSIGPPPQTWFSSVHDYSPL